MAVINYLKKVLHTNNKVAVLEKKLNQYATIVKSIHLTIFILDKNQMVIETYNVDHIARMGISNNNITAGKPLRYAAIDESSLLYGFCNAIEETINMAYSVNVPAVAEYNLFDFYLKITATIIDENILVQIKDITDLQQKLQQKESNNYKELSMALLAGGLTSWKYDVETKMVSSSSNNIITGEMIPFEVLIRENTLSPYRESALKLINDIVNLKVDHSEIIIQSKDKSGNILWINVHAIPYAYNSKGEVTIIAGSQKDITKEYNYNHEINELNRQNELILNNIKSALVYITPDYRVIWENVSKVFKYSFANKYYRKGSYCYSAFDRDTPCESCVMKRAMQSGKSEMIEFTSSEGISVEIIANPILSKDCEMEGIVLKIDDVTERKETIQKLKEAQQKEAAASQLLYTILDNLPSSIFAKDANDDYRYVIANKKLCEGLGLSENEMIGKTDYDLFEKEVADKYRQDDVETIESNQTKIINGELIYEKNGVVLWYTVKTPLINIEDNNKKLVVGIGMDITESNKAFQELAIAKKKAEESDNLKSAFLANMSHEIRTPLNAIVGFSELMESCEGPQEKAEYMRIISVNSDLLLRLINDILDLSKLESGIIQFDNAEFDLAQYFDELSKSLKQRITNPDVKFIEVNPYKSCIIETDKSRLTQVLHNFMTNAIKYTTSGYIKMGYECVDNGIKLYVEDTGIGIAEDKKCKMFQRFEKLDSFAQGTGLGLSICKAITELGGGKIGFESTFGEGSLFWSWKPIPVKNIECHKALVKQINYQDRVCQ